MQQFSLGLSCSPCPISFSLCLSLSPSLAPSFSPFSSPLPTHRSPALSLSLFPFSLPLSPHIFPSLSQPITVPIAHFHIPFLFSLLPSLSYHSHLSLSVYLCSLLLSFSISRAPPLFISSNLSHFLFHSLSCSLVLTLQLSLHLSLTALYRIYLLSLALPNSPIITFLPPSSPLFSPPLSLTCLSLCHRHASVCIYYNYMC